MKMSKLSLPLVLSLLLVLSSLILRSIISPSTPTHTTLFFTLPFSLSLPLSEYYDNFQGISYIIIYLFTHRAVLEYCVGLQPNYLPFTSETYLGILG